MTKIQEKWRESLTDINDVDFKNVEFEKIISYPPAGNDVLLTSVRQCLFLYHPPTEM